ncbi:MAG: rRNA maturation RNase YbeY, partial [Patescibacteria group bacterium]
IKKAVVDFLAQKKVKDPVEISIAIVGKRKIRGLNKKYRKIDAPTDVLSFGLESRDNFIDYKDDVLRLGDVIVCWPVAVDEAAEEEVLMDDKINELVLHGVTHLLGEHHEE